MTAQRAYDLSARIVSLKDSLETVILPLVERHFAKANNQPAASFSGQGRDLILEAQVRACLLDPLLKELGWDIASTMLVEAGIEGINDVEHRRFLDYFGVGTLSDTKSLVLVEAKRLSVSLPLHDTGMDSRQIIIDALGNSFKSDTDIHPLSPEWAKILRTLADYVARLAHSNYGAPKRAVLSNGEWFIVFLEPFKSLLERRLEPKDFIVATSLSEASKLARELVDALAFEYLVEFSPAINCEDLRLHADHGAGNLNAVLSYEVYTGAIGQNRAEIGFQPSVVVQVPSGRWLRFTDHSQNRTLLRGIDKLPEDMDELDSNSQILVGKLHAQAHLTFIDSKAYEDSIMRKPEFPSTTLVRLEAPNCHVLHTGVVVTPFVNLGEYTNCPYHAHGQAFQEGHAVTPSPILRPTINPPVHFTSGSPNHCSSKKTENLKKDCPMMAITRHVCCRACSLQTRCWPDGFDALPCIAVPDDDVDISTLVD